MSERVDTVMKVKVVGEKHELIMCKSVSDSVTLHLYKMNECTLIISKIYY